MECLALQSDPSQRPSVSTNANIVTKTEPAGSQRLRRCRLGEFESVTKGSVSAILVHPSRLFSEGLRRILAGTPFELAWLAAAADQVPQKFRNTGRRLFFIVGGNDAADRAQSVRAILRQHTSARIVVIGNCSGASEVMSALEAGAGGYIRESISCEALLKALELVTLNETVLPANFIKELPRWTGPIHGTTPPALPGPTPPALPEQPSEDAAQESQALALSTREAAILHNLVHGASNKVIAQRLGITDATVKVHVKAILRKIRVKNRTQAAIWAVRHPLDTCDASTSKYPSSNERLLGTYCRIFAFGRDATLSGR